MLSAVVMSGNSNRLGTLRVDSAQKGVGIHWLVKTL